MICLMHHGKLAGGKAVVLSTLAAVIAAMTLMAAPPARAQTYTVLYNVAGAPTDGAVANGELVQDAAGNLYGTTYRGGTSNLGAVFMLDAGGVMTILHSFAQGEGRLPEGGLFRDPNGDLYGTTTAGGADGVGTVFKLETNNVLTTLHSFKGGTDGAQPWSRLISINGELYGTTGSGGGNGCGSPSGCGTIFKISKGGLKTIVYRLRGKTDGGDPQSIIRDSAGNIYGIAGNSGINGKGTVFKLDAAGVFTVLYAFTGGTDGGFPAGSLIWGTNGDLHGVTANGGDPICDCGVVFRLDTSGNETVLHKFFGRGGGSQPSVGLLDVAGVLYGTTTGGGDLTCNPPGGCGLLYRIEKTGQYTILHRFAGAAAGDGAWPAYSQLTLGADGSIYSATWSGGTGGCKSGSFPGCGVIFKYTP